MTNEEQVAVCKAIAAACMWGHGGLAHGIVEKLQKQLPLERPWREVFDEHKEQAQREAVGVLTDEGELCSWLRAGYWIANPGTLFHPPPMNGLFMYLSPELAAKYTPGSTR